jgi:hypothetical protein
MGDFDFIIKVFENDEIRKMYDKKWYRECLYFLAMVDYLCKSHDLLTAIEYNDLRELKLSEMLYPLGVITLCLVSNSEQPKENALKDAIPEFLKYNIVEGDIRDVV